MRISSVITIFEAKNHYLRDEGLMSAKVLWLQIFSINSIISWVKSSQKVRPVFQKCFLDIIEKIFISEIQIFRNFNIIRFFDCKNIYVILNQIFFLGMKSYQKLSCLLTLFWAQFYVISFLCIPNRIECEMSSLWGCASLLYRFLICFL